MSDIDFQAELARIAARVEHLGGSSTKAAPAKKTVPSAVTSEVVERREPIAVRAEEPAPVIGPSDAASGATPRRAQKRPLLIAGLLVLCVAPVAVVSGLSAAMSREAPAAASEPVVLPSVVVRTSPVVWEEEPLEVVPEVVEPSEPVSPVPSRRPEKEEVPPRAEPTVAPPVDDEVELAVSAPVTPARAAVPVLRPLDSPKPEFTANPDTPPVLRNGDQVQDALTSRYPEHLRRHRVGGRVMVSLLVSEEGRVLESRVDSGSGNAQVDALALQVASTMRFSPPHHGGKTTRTRVLMPLTFQ